ncbi:hypothetical protein H0H93_008905 [Arthromyces matolae]|nr:hypothetical protein H0H93_008905 [Arthromyces matolae]
MSTSQQPNSAIPAFDNTLGALLVGGLVSMASSRDPLVFKLLIAFLWVLDTFDAALNCHILYYYLVTNYLNPLAIAKPVWFNISAYAELDKLSNLFYLNFAAGTGSDLSVAFALTWLLVKAKTGFRRIDAALGLIFYVVMPGNFVFLGFYLLLSKCKEGFSPIVTS